MRRSLFVLVVLVAACSNAVTETGSTTPATTIVVATTTTTPTTTTTTEPANTNNGEISPINGMPVDDPRLLERRVVAVKIDNHPDAWPQSGLDQANAVIELPVEGITRFIALFHDGDSEFLGPVRSARPTDGEILHPLGATFAISGGQDWIITIIRDEEVRIIGEELPEMFRISDRFAPHDLYTNTNLLRKTADDRRYPDDPPPRLFEFGPMPAGAERAREVVIDFGNDFIVTWKYDLATGRYVREVNGLPALLATKDGDETPVSADTLVALMARRYIEQAPSGATSVPAMQTTGSGVAFVFFKGRMVKGTWSRETTADLFELVDESGDPIEVPPGFLWLSVVPRQNPIVAS
jgi:hypothetical protein